jgi:uroporphyrinogen III methyltransferase / synthase
VGTVHLVGAGPGDPGLLTFRAAELLRRADAVVYDALANDRFLELVNPAAELLYVGKRGGREHMTQDEINRLLVEVAGRVETVVRLKGGDPFVFGRGGEEALALRAAGIRFEVVPGVTAGVAVPAYAGIPVTHRGYTPALTLVTAHEDPTKAGNAVAWEQLARSGATLSIYMGISQLPSVVKQLIEGGRPADTPAAVVEWGTYPRQRTVTGTLGELPALVEREAIGAPAIVVVGAVVELREQLDWFENRPLFGRRIVVTRARAQASEFAAALEGLGAEIVQFPAIRVVPAADPEPLRRAVREVGTYDWIVFTSVNGVERFWEELERAGQDTRALGGVRVACVGPATAALAELHGVRPDVVPSSYVGEAVLGALAQVTPLAGQRVLLPRAAGARPVLPEGLAALGAVVADVEAYRSVPDAAGAAELRQQLDAGRIDAVTFTASSTVRSFVDAVGADVGRAIVAAIGPITAATARDAGLDVRVEAEEHTIPGLLRALSDHFADRTAAP